MVSRSRYLHCRVRFTNQPFHLQRSGPRITPAAAKSKTTGKPWPPNMTSGNTFNSTVKSSTQPGQMQRRYG